ncbi:prepilin-type N-terminal cleavage/methylation domain-containing protein [Candidatus Dependentiae bacterium]|nr:prepilin-type N-terminal cleavage/methylation domain-containing protein [Candidatus Dependentiae bacterium]
MRIKRISNNQWGFTLLELMIGFMISTLLITVSFTIYQQIARSTQFVATIAATDTQIMILNDRLRKDILGILPLWFLKKDYEQNTKNAAGVSPIPKLAKENKEAKEIASETHESLQAEEKIDEKEMKANNFFCSMNKDDGTFDYVSFVTTSALQVYQSCHNPCVRVVYSLKQDGKNSYGQQKLRLLRKELTDLEFDQDKVSSPENFYEIAQNIKSFSIEYGFIDPMKSGDTKTKESLAPKQIEKAPDIIELTWLKDWVDKKENSIQKTLFPKFIKIKIAFLQEKSDHEKEYNLCYSIFIDNITPYHSFTHSRKQQSTPVQAKTEAGIISEQKSSLPTNTVDANNAVENKVENNAMQSNKAVEQPESSLVKAELQPVVSSGEAHA